MLSCRNFMVSSLTHRFLIRFESILCVVSGNVPLSCNCIIFPAPLLKRLYFLHLYFCLLCCRLVDHKCLGLFLGCFLFRPDKPYEWGGWAAILALTQAAHGSLTVAIANWSPDSHWALALVLLVPVLLSSKVRVSVLWKKNTWSQLEPNSQAFFSSNLGPNPFLSRVVTAMKQKISLAHTWLWS